MDTNIHSKMSQISIVLSSHQFLHEITQFAKM